MADRIARGCNVTITTRVVALDLSKLFKGCSMLVYFSDLVQVKFLVRFSNLFFHFRAIKASI